MVELIIFWSAVFECIIYLMNLVRGKCDSLVGLGESQFQEGVNLAAKLVFVTVQRYKPI
jgi:hypothetical protein